MAAIQSSSCFSSRVSSKGFNNTINRGVLFADILIDFHVEFLFNSNHDLSHVKGVKSEVSEGRVEGNGLRVLDIVVKSE
jgi:hypothetical protein